MHEYVTTPVKRVLRIAGREIFYIETINSRYRLEVRGREEVAAESTRAGFPLIRVVASAGHRLIQVRIRAQIGHSNA